MFSEPITITRTRDHEFESRIPKKLLKKGQLDLCKHCRLGKHNVVHHAFPESFNQFGSGSREAYQNAKKGWSPVYIDMLEESGLERGIKRVLVEANYTLGKRYAVDQDNLRYPASKFLGDAMQTGGWIKDDGRDRQQGFWIFSFGGLEIVDQPGIWQADLTIFAEYD